MKKGKSSPSQQRKPASNEGMKKKTSVGLHHERNPNQTSRQKTRK